MKLLNSPRFVRAGLVIVVAAALTAAPTQVRADDEQRFNSPEAAVAALTDAAKARDTNAIHRIFGDAGRELVSADVVEATEAFNLFVQRLTEKADLIREADNQAQLQIGTEAWPFPIPLMKTDGNWHFDVAAGKEEILNRRIGANELGAIDVCQAYVDAQREYASRDRKGDQVLEYAQFLMSTPGAHDGLYWPAKAETDEMSPLGPLIAQARFEGYHRRTGLLTEDQTPYHGYYFKILSRQGRHAPGGKYNYIINGHMIGGFALIAWPAEWGNTGVMTFIVNQQGKVLQKNLGPHTASRAKAISAYDPDDSWTPALGK